MFKLNKVTICVVVFSIVLGFLIETLPSHSSPIIPISLQKEQLEVKESRGGRGNSGMTEDEVFSKVASLFKGQEDLLAEFGQFLPDAKRSLVSKKIPARDKIISQFQIKVNGFTLVVTNRCCLRINLLYQYIKYLIGIKMVCSISRAELQMYMIIAISYLFLCGIFLSVHRELTDIRERDTEKTR